MAAHSRKQIIKDSFL